MKDIKKTASLKSKVKGKETQFKIDLDYSPEYDSFNIKVKKGEGFMSYTDALQGLPLDVVQNINEMLEEILIKAGSKTEMKEYDNDYADIGQFSLSDSEGKKTEQEYIDLGKKIVKTKFNGDIGKAYDSVVRNKREFGGDFQAGVYASGGGIPNNYEGKSADEVWKDWSYDQKYHFLSDHREKIGFEEDLYNESKRTTKPKKSSMGTDIGFMYIDIDKIINTKYTELPRYVKFALLDHVRSGQYNKGGSITNERKHVNKDENYEVRYAKPRPSRKGYKGLRSFEDGGGIGNYYIVTFGFNGDEGYQVVNSKPIFAKSQNEAELMLKDQFESYEGQSCDIISTKKQLKDGGGIGIEEKIDLTDDKRLRLRKPVMPKRKLTQQEWAEKHNPRAYEYMGKTKMATGGALVGNQKRIDLNKNGKIDAEDFKLLRSSMNGAWRNDHKHVNHDEDYEVRYAKPRPNRKGYKGKRKFATGGGLSFGGKNPKIEKYSVYIEYGNEDENEMKVVELDFPSLQQASNVFKQYSKLNKYKGQDIFDIMILKYYMNGDFRQVDDEYSKGGYVEITDPKKELFDKGYAIYGGDAWETFESVKKIPLPKGAFIVKVKTKDNDYFAIAEKRKFGEGGGISNFERLSRVVAKNYEGKRVKPKYQKEYGKTYSKSEAKEVGNKVAGKVKANQKMATGGKTNRGGIMVLAKKIRKDGESWKDALKRAGEQMK